MFEEVGELQPFSWASIHVTLGFWPFQWRLCAARIGHGFIVGAGPFDLVVTWG